jgi:hypothetical protein
MVGSCAGTNAGASGAEVGAEAGAMPGAGFVAFAVARSTVPRTMFATVISRNRFNASPSINPGA